MPNQTTAMTAMRIAKAMPLRSPTSISRRITRQALARPRSRVASARTATVMVCVPALPPIEATIGIRTASATIFCSESLEQPDHRGGEERRAEIDEEPGRAALQDVPDVVRQFLVGVDAAERLDVGVGLLLEDVDDVVDHHRADEAAGLVDDGGRDEVVALEEPRHLLLLARSPSPGRDRRP